MAQENNGEPHWLSGKHILVAGGGIAGLAFVRFLDRTWPVDVERPRVTLYEKREQKVSPEREGYSMSIRSDAMSGGMQALQKLCLLNETLAASITGRNGGRGSMYLWDVDWQPILKFKQPATPPDGLPANSMRIARYILRQNLIDGLPSSCDAHWNISCESAEQLDDGKMRVTLSDGSTTDCDFLVAADGANSMIRASIRPSDKLQFAGAVSISANAKFPDGLPDLIKENHGMVLGGGGSTVFVSPIDEHSAIWSVSFREPKPREPLRGDESIRAKDEILSEARERGKAFIEPFRTLMAATDPKTLHVFNAMDKQPINHSELTNKSVVFVGDSNHAVSPFAGNGANMALMDGVDLATALRESKDANSAIEAFDKSSMIRSKRTIASSHWVIAIAHSTGWRLALYKIFLHFINFLMSF
jgi:2-polyprenyl-6-methoxyphenol hydroxylase-like FAD-dependent oxidoreductase